MIVGRSVMVGRGVGREGCGVGRGVMVGGV